MTTKRRSTRKQPAQQTTEHSPLIPDRFGGSYRMSCIERARERRREGIMAAADNPCPERCRFCMSDGRIRTEVTPETHPRLFELLRRPENFVPGQPVT